MGIGLRAIQGPGARLRDWSGAERQVRFGSPRATVKGVELCVAQRGLQGQVAAYIRFNAGNDLAVDVVRRGEVRHDIVERASKPHRLRRATRFQ